MGSDEESSTGGYWSNQDYVENALASRSSSRGRPMSGMEKLVMAGLLFFVGVGGYSLISKHYEEKERREKSELKEKYFEENGDAMIQREIILNNEKNDLMKRIDLEDYILLEFSRISSNVNTPMMLSLVQKREDLIKMRKLYYKQFEDRVFYNNIENQIYNKRYSEELENSPDYGKDLREKEKMWATKERPKYEQLLNDYVSIRQKIIKENPSMGSLNIKDKFGYKSLDLSKTDLGLGSQH